MDILRHLIMPAAILGLAAAGPLTRYVRGSLIDELSADYVRTAEAKGAAPVRVVSRHALRNSLIPLITIIMINIPQMLAGAVVLEQVFAWPGMGQLAVRAVNTQDYPVIVGFALYVGGAGARLQPARRHRLRRRRPESEGLMSDLRPSLDTPDVAAAEQVVSAEATGGPRSRRRSPKAMAVRRFRRNKVAVGGAVFLVLLLIVALLAPLLAGTSPYSVDLGAIRQAPSAEHWLGTDASGRDVFARLVYAARVSLLVGVAAALLAVVVGTLVGAVAGLFGGWIDTVLMRTADMMLSFPNIVVVIVLAGLLGPSIPILVIAIAAAEWPTAARLVRGVTLAVREREYLHAARVAGASRGWMLRKHIVPAAMGQIVVVGTISVAGAILSEAVLSFLGLGVQPPQASWGNMLNDAQSLTVIQSMPWLWLPPGLAIAATVLSVNFVGDGLRDAVDPRQTGRQ